MQFNRVFIGGNLTFDPELRTTPGGTSVCQLRLATNRRFTTQSGEQREEVCFVDVDVWGRQAENCGRYLQKGSAVFVEGRLQMDQWQDRQTGQNRTKLKINASTVQFLNRAGGGEGGGNQQQPQQGGGYGQPQQGGYGQPQPSYGQQQPPPGGGYGGAPQGPPQGGNVPPPGEQAPPPFPGGNQQQPPQQGGGGGGAFDVDDGESIDDIPF